ncbi:P97 family adhesin [Mesomycoplasma ovipneumoniae]|uniref:P97 family adhesin n=1 Tax=Mesomycoplasma ovipneumoniae TaxID=29562 RepID=UPI00311CBB3D
MSKSTITKKLLTKKNIFLLGLSTIAGGAIIAVPLVVFANLELKNPRIDVQNQAKSISFISIKDKYLNANSDYLDLKKKLLNDDNTKKTDIDLTDFFDFYQTNNSSIPVNFSTDHNWKPFKLEIFDIKPDDNEQTFEVFWRVSQKLDDNKTAISDLFKQKVAYNYVPDYSLSNFSTYSEEKLKKLRPYTNSEVNFSFKKELTKLISVEDFQKEVNTAKNDTEAREIINKYFNLDEIISQIFSNKSFYFESESGIQKPRYDINLVKDQIITDRYLVKTATPGVYKLTFVAQFSSDFSKEIAADINKNSKFFLTTQLNLSDSFLDKSISDDIVLSEFSDSDYFAINNFSQNNSTLITGWDFLNYYNNEIFATKENRANFLNSLIEKIVKTPLISKIRFQNKLANLNFNQISKFLDVQIKLDTEQVNLDFKDNDVVAQINGDIVIKDKRNDKIVATKKFSQSIKNFELLAQNDPDFAASVNKSALVIQPNAQETVAKDKQKGIPKDELLALIQSNNFDKLKKVLQNSRYYGFRFDETQLKSMVDTYNLPTVEDLIKNSNVDDAASKGITSIYSNYFNSDEKIAQFLSFLSKQDISFVAKYWFDYLKHFKLIEAGINWPEDLNTNELFRKLSEITIKPTKQPRGQIGNDNSNPTVWLFSFNYDFLKSNQHLENSFYINDELKNTLNLIKTNPSISPEYFIKQIELHAKQISKADFSQEIPRNNIENLTDFLAAFYSLAYSKQKSQKLFTGNFGKDFNYKIQFSLEPNLTNVDALEKPNEEKLKVKYWYNIGPVDKNGDLASVIYRTKKSEIELKINSENKLLSDEVDKLDEIASTFSPNSQIVFLTKEDFEVVKTQINLAISTKEGEPVSVDKQVEKLPFSSYLTFEHKDIDLGFYAIKSKQNQTPGTTDTSNTASQTTTDTDISGVLEKIPNTGNRIQHNLFLYLYDKNNPKNFSSQPIRVIIMEHTSSLLLK